MRVNYKSAVLLIALVIVFACSGVEKGAEEESGLEPDEALVGRWKFVSMKGTSSTGDVLYPYGEDFFGMLMYDSKGYMSVVLMRYGREKFGSDDVFGGTFEEIKAAFQGFDAYCGTYEVDTENKSVTHHIEGSKFPNWEGTSQVRFYEISEDRLKLKAPPIELGGVEWNLEAELVRQ